MKILRAVLAIYLGGGIFAFSDERAGIHDHGEHLRGMPDLALPSDCPPEKPGKGYTLMEQLGYSIAAVAPRSIAGDLVLAVPIDSVYHPGGTTFVLAENPKDPHIFERWQVKLGETDGKLVEVLEGLLPGDRIVIQTRKLWPIAPQLNPYRKGAISDSSSKSKLFGVQVGAFSSAVNAERVANQLRPRFGRADVLQSVSNGRSLYRVRVGEFLSVSSARAISAQIAGSGFPQAFVVPF